MVFGFWSNTPLSPYRTVYLSGVVLPVVGASQSTVIEPLSFFVTLKFVGTPTVGTVVVLDVVVVVAKLPVAVESSYLKTKVSNSDQSLMSKTNFVTYMSVLFSSAL